MHFYSSSDKTVKVWDLKNKQCEHTFNEHTNQVNNVLFINLTVFKTKLVKRMI